MADEKIPVFSESLARCLADPAFVDRFYELFIASSDEIAQKFRNTNFVRQKFALTSSLYVMVLAMEGGEDAVRYLDKIAQRHGETGLAIRPELYDQWLDCLVRAASEFDPQFDEKIEQAWRNTMEFGIEFMRSRY